MTALALLLVLIAAFAHSGWNYLTKRAAGGVAFIWTFAGLATLFYAPLAIGMLVVQKPTLRLANLGFIVLSGCINSLYFFLLEKGYRLGDLSVVYPVARGTGPLISAVVGITVLGERPSAVGIAGIVLMTVGIAAVTGNPLALKSPEARKAVGVALLCGLTVATYTVVDKVAVAVLKTPPLVQEWGQNSARVLILLPFALRDWNAVREQWRLHRREAMGVAVLSPLAYILVLTAMVFTPVSYVAPAREISILIGAIIGARLLSEGNVRARILGTAAMVVGLIALALG